ncbi:hypothetical protein [Bradyrhizobium japonicum]|uniref:hypothetical protein n=1 Tax=Bradyrhizobium japonicum TaxID=375 RepID=UPI0004569B13|nr:hypothetical protein [Bradyrhizobium japonicum]AHY48917.1 hypothetical protein BJS_07375 [Bradyrhizobium japonicum SEMIA 5079]MCD9108927.1 hypothetical protein [Bradyrhizobium japonicum]MCD9255228.1 hypothetical protein [Bradyrhizobium japonicum SEMIA 5079]MCD9821840.1 hypothetical protein [Bradyrhizobium japonicum]MCD9893857.1 hypothetical protein [Bradyrhizobium japonicum]
MIAPASPIAKIPEYSSRRDCGRPDVCDRGPHQVFRDFGDDDGSAGLFAIDEPPVRPVALRLFRWSSHIEKGRRRRRPSSLAAQSRL